MDFHPGQLKRLVTARSIVFLVLALTACYISRGTTFLLVVLLGVVLGCIAAGLSITSSRAGTLQFGLRTLLVVITLVAVLLVWHQNRFRYQRLAIAEIQRLGGSVAYANRMVGEFLIGTDANARPVVDGVSLTNLPLSPGDLRCLAWLTEMKRLDLDYSHFGDAGLVHLADLTNLEWLDLEDTQTTDDGLVHLQKLQSLEALILDGNPITNDGLARLKKLKRLKYLRVRNTKVTAEGASRFEKAMPGCRVGFQ